MNPHMVDHKQLKSMYAYWSNVFFGSGKKKPAAESPKKTKPAKAEKTGSETSSYSTTPSPAGTKAGASATGAADLFGDVKYFAAKMTPSSNGSPSPLQNSPAKELAYAPNPYSSTDCCEDRGHRPVDGKGG